MPSLRNRNQKGETTTSRLDVTLKAKENKAERTGERIIRYPDEEKELGWQ